MPFDSSKPPTTLRYDDIQAMIDVYDQATALAHGDTAIVKAAELLVALLRAGNRPMTETPPVTVEEPILTNWSRMTPDVERTRHFRVNGTVAAFVRLLLDGRWHWQTFDACSGECETSEEATARADKSLSGTFLPDARLGPWRRVYEETMTREARTLLGSVAASVVTRTASGLWTIEVAKKRSMDLHDAFRLYGRFATFGAISVPQPENLDEAMAMADAQAIDLGWTCAHAGDWHPGVAEYRRRLVEHERVSNEKDELLRQEAGARFRAGAWARGHLPLGYGFHGVTGDWSPGEAPEDETPFDETPEDETPLDETPEDETPEDKTP
jgi:hypothetical protein